MYALRPDRLSVLPRIWLLTIAYILFPRADRDEFAQDPKFYSKRGFVGGSSDLCDESGKLVGGLYGLAIGRVFFGELQFSLIEHTSKIAVVALHRHLATWGYRLRDAKWIILHLASFGFRTMQRDQFLSQLANYLLEPGHEGRWALDPVIGLGPPKG